MAALLAASLLLAGPAWADAARLQPPRPAAATAETPAAPASPPPFDRALAEAVLREILAALRDRYVEPVALPDLAFRAAGGLAGLDARLGLRRGGGDWRLLSDGRTLAVWRAPEAADAAGWATLLAAFAASAQASPAVRAAGHPGTMAALLDPLPTATDPFTRYVPPAEARAAEGRRRGEGGIGVRAVPAADGAAIVEVVPEGPADHAGLAVGDRILAVDGVRLRGLSEAAIAARLSGDEDTRIVLTVRPARGGGTRQVAVIRALIVAPSVQAERRGNVAIFRLTTFNRLTDQHLARALLEAKAQPEPLGGIVLDLRGNRGGLLRQAVAVADLFLAHGEIAATRGRHPDAARTYVAAGADLADRLPIVVLVDGATASAAEIVAASLQAQRRAAVVGSATMGKGLVQTVVRLPDDGELVMTWSRVLVPPGIVLNGLGVVPVLCTANGAEATARALASLRGAIAPEPRLHAAAGDRAGLARARAACPPREAGAEDLGAAMALVSDPVALAAAVGVAALPAPPRRTPREHLAGAD